MGEGFLDKPVAVWAEIVGRMVVCGGYFYNNSSTWLLYGSKSSKTLIRWNTEKKLTEFEQNVTM